MSAHDTISVWWWGGARTHRYCTRHFTLWTPQRTTTLRNDNKERHGRFGPVEPRGETRVKHLRDPRGINLQSQRDGREILTELRLRLLLFFYRKFVWTFKKIHIKNNIILYVYTAAKPIAFGTTNADFRT